MNKLYYLLKLQAMQWFGINKVLHAGDKKEKRKLIGIFALILVVAVLCVFSVVVYSTMIAYVLQPIGKLEWLPGIMMAASGIVISIFSIMKANGFLFGFQDYDLLMSMPVKTSVVVASRLLQMYGMNIGLTALFMIPSSAVYCVFAAPSPWFYIWMIPGILVIPLVPMVAASLVGLAVIIATLHLRHKNIVSLLIMIVLLLGLMAGSISLDTAVEDMGAVLTTAMENIMRVYPMTRLFIDGICAGDIGSLLLLIGLSLVIVGLFCWGLGHWYRQINGRLSAGGTKTRYSLQSLKQGTPFSALCGREWRRYISSPLYVMNTSVGYILLMAGAVALLFVDVKTAMESVGIFGVEDVLPRMIPFVMMLFVGMYTMTGCCISLEGNQLWLVKCLPVTSKAILQAKLMTSMCIQAPLILAAGILLVFVFPFSIWNLFWNIFLPLLFAFNVSVTGLIMNLTFPNFSWTSEVTVIKQSPAVMLTMLVNVLGAGGSLAAAIWASSRCIPTLGISSGIFMFWLIAAIILYSLLMKKGATKFSSFT